MTDERKVSKTTIKTAEKYIARMKAGERMMRDSRGIVQWADGKSVGPVTLAYMMKERLIRELDTDLFGNPHRGQTLGLES